MPTSGMQPLCLHLRDVSPVFLPLKTNGVYNPGDTKGHREFRYVLEGITGGLTCPGAQHKGSHLEVSRLFVKEINLLILKSLLEVQGPAGIFFQERLWQELFLHSWPTSLVEAGMPGSCPLTQPC